MPDEALMPVIVGISQVSLAKLAGTVERAPRVIPNAFVIHSPIIRSRHCSTFPSRFPNPHLAEGVNLGGVSSPLLTIVL